MQLIIYQYFTLCFLTGLDLFPSVKCQDYEYPDYYGNEQDPCETALDVNGTFGTIQHTNYPSQNPAIQDCNWNVKVSDGMRIAVKFPLGFAMPLNSLGKCDDVLSFNDNGTTRQFCGTETPNSFLSATNLLLIKFMSKESVQFSAFAFNWTAIDSTSIPTPSQYQIYNKEGIISSPNYPRSYDNFESSTWHLMVNATKFIYIQFNSTFDLEIGENGQCSYDNLVLYEGKESNSAKILQTFCTWPSTPMVLKTNQITLLFTSDSTVTGLGFSLSYKAIDPVQCDNTIIINGTMGVVSSPYYPIPYEDNLSCTWRIIAPKKQRIAIQFSNLFNIKHDGSCTSDLLQVFDGPSILSKQYMEGICGKFPPRGFLSSTNNLTLVFMSGTLTGNAEGFSLNWTAEAECLSDDFQCWDGSCVDGTEQCDGKIDCPNDPADEAECSHLNTTSDCGNQSIAPEFFWEQRIIGGSEAKQGSWPWQVSLTRSANAFCAGVLISDEWVLTAAHCYLKGSTIVAVLGDYNTTDFDSAKEQRIEVDQVIIHYNYEYSNAQGYLSGNDLALLHLSVPIERTAWVQPICLSSTPLLEGQTVITVGWGQRSTVNAEFSQVLRQVRLQVTSSSKCRKAFETLSSSPYPNGVVCFTASGAGLGVCTGDSGGPAMRLTNGRWELIGIVSFSGKCGSTGMPSYFTDVLAFSSYIQKYSRGGKQTVYEKRIVINSESGNLSAPRSNEDSLVKYSPNTLYQWFISVGASKRITVRFKNLFKIEFGGESCPYDYLIFYDGPDTLAAKYLNKKFCGSQAPPDFESNSNSIIVEFRSDNSYEETGFELTWTTSDDCKPEEFRCGNGTCIDISLKCNGLLDCVDGFDEILCKLPLPLPSSPQCGVSEVAVSSPWYPLIRSGTNAVEGSWPWQVALYESNGEFVCGATLIDGDWALTAASCIKKTNGYMVSLGDYDLGYTGMNEKLIKVEEVTRFPSYNKPGLDDIATLRLEVTVDATKWIKPICLPSSSDTVNPVTGTTCMLTGWGATAIESERREQRILQQVPFTVLSDAECIETFRKLSLGPYTSNKLPENLICAGHKQNRAGACLGDTGGPLQCLVDGTWRQYGILSFGNTCDKYSFFERVTSYKRWIDENIASAQCDELNMVEGTAGSIEVPTVNGTYPNNLNCSWLISAPVEKLLTISFEYFDVESNGMCLYDSVIIYDGSNRSSPMYLDEVLCGNNRTIRGFESSTNEILVTFISDASRYFRGFKILWEAIDGCKSDEFRCWDGSCIDAEKRCDGKSDCSKSRDEIECDNGSGYCGKQRSAPQFLWTPRVYGGSYAKKGSWPWQVYILDYLKTHKCGATIISQEWILTAAHCTFLGSYFFVGIGGHDQSNRTSDQIIQVNTSRDVWRHSKYNQAVLSNGYDIALIKTESKIIFSATVQPICISPNEISADMNCVSTGWGRIKLDSAPSKILRQVRLPINTYDACEKANGGNPFNQDLLFCAGNLGGGQDTCPGDSGGPLVCFEGNNWFQFGIVSYGNDGLDCGQTDGAGFYTMVSYFEDWIQNVTNETFPVPSTETTTLTITDETEATTYKTLPQYTDSTVDNKNNKTATSTDSAILTTGLTSTTSGNVSSCQKISFSYVILLILRYCMLCKYI